jgi:ABC-type transport system involved in multi-copper enzyme maturation permease subunit
MGSGLSRIVAVAANTFRETVRERVLYNLVFFAMLMTLAGLLLGQLSIRQDEKILKDIGLASIDLFGTIIALFIGVGLVSKEIERRSLYPLLAKPLTREELFLGKFAGLAFTLLVNVSVMTLGVYATLLATRRPVSLALLEGVFPLYLGFLVIVALAMLFSTVTSSTLSAVGTLGLVLAGRYSDVIRNLRDVAPDTPDWMVRALYYLIPNFRNFDFKTQVAYGEAVPLDVLGWVTLYAAVYLAVLLGLGTAIFRSRDFQ